MADYFFRTVWKAPLFRSRVIMYAQVLHTRDEFFNESMRKIERIKDRGKKGSLFTTPILAMGKFHFAYICTQCESILGMCCWMHALFMVRLSMTIGIVSISTKSSFNLPTTTTPCVEQTVGGKVGLTFFSCLIGDLRCVRKHSCLLKSPLCTFNSRLGTNCDNNACHHRFGIFCML